MLKMNYFKDPLNKKTP